MKTIKTKVVAIIMAVAMVFALGMTSMAATKNYDDLRVGDTLNAGDMIRNNHGRNLVITITQDGGTSTVTLSQNETYTIPNGVTASVTSKESPTSRMGGQYKLSITLTAVSPTPAPSRTVDYDDLSEGSTLNAGDTITNNGHSSPVIVDINEGESSARINRGDSYTIPDGMTATVTGKSYDWSQRAHILEVTMTAAPGGTSGLTPEQRRALSIDAFVENMYIDVLGRNFDSEGRASFIAALNGNEMTGSDVVRAMFNSEEYAARNQTDEEFIATLCQVMAHRAPTDAEIATWTTALASGTTRAQVVDTFLATEEFANVCAFFQVNV